MIRVIGKRKNKVLLNCGGLKCGKTLVIKVRDFVDLTNFSYGVEKLIC
jgi:hypothetical protein